MVGYRQDSPTGRPGRRGFTLLEVLVVLIIIGVVLGLAMLSLNFSSHEQLLEREASRLKALIEAARQEAVLNDLEIGVYFEPGGYSFYRLHEDAWVEMKGHALLYPRYAPDGYGVGLVIDDLPALPGDGTATDGSGSGGRTHAPQVFLLSSGELTPFEAVFSRLDDTTVYHRLKVAANGVMEMHASGQDGGPAR